MRKKGIVKWSTYYQARLNREDAQRERKKSRDTSRDDTSGIWRSEKLRFWRNPEDVLNRLNSVSWDWVRSRAGVTWVTKGNQRSPGGGEQWGEVVKVMGFFKGQT